MKKTILLGITAALVGLISCEKDGNHLPAPADSVAYDTIKPLNYFPVYPGSSWTYLECKKIYEYDSNSGGYNYVRTDSAIVVDSVSLNYVAHAYETVPEWDGSQYIQKYSDTVYVPLYNGEPIYQYSKIDIASEPPFGPITYYKKYMFLSDHVGDTLIPQYYDTRFNYLGPYLVIQEKTVDKNNDSVIVVKGYYYGNYNDGGIDWITYKKNVGLVSFYSVSPTVNDTIYKKVLVDYTIKRD